MIQPEFKNLIDVLDRKLFRIPEYQRHYSWQTKQRNDLFEDIKNLQEKRKKYDERIHFMATIVCLRTKDKAQIGSEIFSVYEVVDGQQRLTTLIILLKSISIKLRQNKQEAEANEIDKLLVKNDRRLIILQNNHDNLSLFRNYLAYGDKPQADSIKTLADHNLSQAIKDCEKFVSSSDDVVGLLTLIKNYLFFIFQSLDDKGSVYTIFEVLNSRGLDVDWLDKCKSMLMGFLYEFSNGNDENVFKNHLDELHSYWAEIYRAIGLQPIRGHEIVQFAATLKTVSDAGSPFSAEEALDFFKSECIAPADNDDRIDKIIGFTILLKDITSCLSVLFDDKRRSAVTEITQARLLAVAIMLRKDLSEQDKGLLLEQWERTAFKIYGLFRKDSRTKRGDFIRVAKRIIRKEKGTTVSDLQHAIADIGAEFNIAKSMPELFTNDYYNDWQKELRYFFYRFEEYLSKSAGIQLDQAIWNEIWDSNVNDTIEHILPQEKSNWKHFSEEDHQKYLHNIGNLCVLSPRLNSEASNRSFGEKKMVYKKSGLRIITEIINEGKSERQTWDVKAIMERCELLMIFASEQWSDL